ncbi:hypothetical protein [Streptomyces pacificus]|uniref:hypothetical protein n=1 Tax=Streptomyces pacificus TaxID=2705029 RepID=UPI001566B8A0|nr:hypothetical protein [Streptomyces pacificus]
MVIAVTNLGDLGPADEYPLTVLSAAAKSPAAEDPRPNSDDEQQKAAIALPADAEDAEFS